MRFSSPRSGLDSPIHKPPECVVLLPHRWTRCETSAAGCGAGCRRTTLIRTGGRLVRLINRAEPGAAGRRVRERLVAFEPRPTRVTAYGHHFWQVGSVVEVVERLEAGLVCVGRHIHADKKD